jgi:polar amino acid transport system permease protein
VRFDFLGNFSGVIAQALLLTIALSAAGLVGGGLIGTVLALIRVLGGRVADRVLMLPIDFIRGTPLLVQLMVWYLVPSASIIYAFAAAAIGLSVNAAPSFRDSAQNHCRAAGQREASLALGLPRSYTVLGIRPQALPAVVPALIGLYIGLIKDTSLAYIVGLHELTRQAKLIADFTFRPLEIYVVIAVLYFILCYPLSRVVPRVERRLRRTGAVSSQLGRFRPEGSGQCLPLTPVCPSRGSPSISARCGCSDNISMPGSAESAWWSLDQAARATARCRGVPMV